MIVRVNAVLGMLLVTLVTSVKTSLVTDGFRMEGRLLCAAMIPITLVSVTTVSPGLSAVAGPVHPGLWGSLDLLLHHDDLVLVLHTAAPVTVLTATRVVLRAETLELDLNLVLWVAPVARTAGAPADDNLISKSSSSDFKRILYSFCCLVNSAFCSSKSGLSALTTSAKS